MTKAEKIREARNTLLAMNFAKKLKVYDTVMRHVDDKTLAKICKVIIDQT